MNKNELKKQLTLLKGIQRADKNWKKIAKNQLLDYVQKNPRRQKRSLLSYPFFRLAPVFRYAVLAILIISIVFVPTGMIFANSAKPGDVLYPIKRAVESGQILFAKDEKERDSLKRQFVLRRIDELEQVIENDEQDTQDKAIDEAEKSIQEILDLPQESKDQKTISQIKNRITKIESQVTSPYVKTKIRKINSLFEAKGVPSTESQITPITTLAPTPTRVIIKIDKGIIQQEIYEAKPTKVLEEEDKTVSDDKFQSSSTEHASPTPEAIEEPKPTGTFQQELVITAQPQVTKIKLKPEEVKSVKRKPFTQKL